MTRHETIGTNFPDKNTLFSLLPRQASTDNPTLLCRVVAPPSSMKTETKGPYDAQARIRGQAGIYGFDLSVFNSQMIGLEPATPGRAETL